MKLHGTVAKLLEEEMAEKGRSRASEEKLIAVSDKNPFSCDTLRELLSLNLTLSVSSAVQVWVSSCIKALRGTNSSLEVINNRDSVSPDIFLYCLRVCIVAIADVPWATLGLCGRCIGRLVAAEIPTGVPAILTRRKLCRQTKYHSWWAPLSFF